MGNQITNGLPNSIDSVLQDIAQMVGGLSYMQIYKFGKVVTKEDLKIVRKLTNIFRDDENDNAAKMVALFIKYRIGELAPVEIDYYSEVIDNWGRTESSKKEKTIVSVLTKPNEFSDDFHFTGPSGSYEMEDVERQVVKVGKTIVLVGSYSDQIPSFVI